MHNDPIGNKVIFPMSVTSVWLPIHPLTYFPQKKPWLQARASFVAGQNSRLSEARGFA